MPRIQFFIFLTEQLQSGRGIIMILEQSDKIINAFLWLSEKNPLDLGGKEKCIKMCYFFNVCHHVS
jgi:hypothetical protein